MATHADRVVPSESKLGLVVDFDRLGIPERCQRVSPFIMHAPGERKVVGSVAHLDKIPTRWDGGGCPPVALGIVQLNASRKEKFTNLSKNFVRPAGVIAEACDAVTDVKVPRERTVLSTCRRE